MSELAAAEIKAAITPSTGMTREPPSAVRSGILIGYARCSTERQDLTAQREILLELGVAEERIYLDHGLTGRNRSRPGLTAHSPPCVRATLVVPKARPTRSLGP